MESRSPEDYLHFQSTAFFLLDRLHFKMLHKNKNSHKYFLDHLSSTSTAGAELCQESFYISLGKKKSESSKKKKKKSCVSPPINYLLEKIKAACVNYGKILQTRYCLKSAVLHRGNKMKLEC